MPLTGRSIVAPVGKPSGGFRRHTSWLVALGVALFCAAVPDSSAALSNIDLNTDPGIAVDGAAAFDQAGRRVAAAGDVNGDGTDDVIVGAWNADNNSRTDSGSAYVIYGSGSPSDLDLSGLTQANGFRIDGAAGDDRLGYSLDGAGDVNDDGYDDVVVGAYNADNNSRADSGSSYVIYGAATQTNLNLSSMTTARGFRIDGAAADDNAGLATGGAGDVNGDGKDDVIVGSWMANGGAGRVYVVYGSASAQANLDLNSLGSRGFRMNGVAFPCLLYTSDAADE